MPDLGLEGWPATEKQDAMPDIRVGELADNRKIRHLRKKVSYAAVYQPSSLNIWGNEQMSITKAEAARIASNSNDR